MENKYYCAHCNKGYASSEEAFQHALETRHGLTLITRMCNERPKLKQVSRQA